ncbi:MAG: aquaporin [Planctomycetota bacterium]
MTEEISNPREGARPFSMLAECIATMAVVFASSLAACQVSSKTLGPLDAAVAVGAVTTAALLGSARRSPGLANPGVLFALFAIGRLSVGAFLRLLASQLFGAVMGASLARGFVSPDILFVARGGAPHWTTHSSAPVAMVAELIAGFVLLWSLLGTTELRLSPRDDVKSIWSRPEYSAVVSGLLAISFRLLFSGGAGAVMNPACSFGPALVGGFWQGQAIYWLGPLAGAMFAAVAWNVCFRPR